MRYTPKRKWKYPLSYERYYSKILLSYVRAIFSLYNGLKEVANNVIDNNSINVDSDDDVTETIIEQIKAKIASDGEMAIKVSGVFDGTNDFNRAEFDAIMKSIKVDAISHERWYNEYKNQWVNDNMALIKSIRDDALRRIQSEMREAITTTLEKGVRDKFLANRIRDLTGVTEKRALLIARDQIGKLNSKVTEYRQRGTGIKQYKWSTSHDSRVRPAHAEREGQIYDWDKPPGDGHPGQPIRCRCIALPVIDFNNLAGQGLYQPRANRTAVSEAMKALGVPRGKLYREIVGAEPIAQDLQPKPFANMVEATKFFEDELSFMIEDKLKKVDNELMVNSLNQLRSLNNKYKALEVFDDDKRMLDTDAKGNVIASVGTNRKYDTVVISFNRKYYKLAIEDFNANQKRMAESGFKMPVDAANYSVYNVMHEYGHVLHNSWLRKHVDFEAMQAELDTKKRSDYTTLSGYIKARDRVISKYTTRILKKEVEWIINKAKEIAGSDEMSDTGISKYGETNIYEWFAESFADSQLNSNPTPTGQAMNLWLKKEGVE